MQYDVGSATVTVTIFFAIFSAGKTCVYAFLTVYFRHLGISPFQAGILRGIQAIVSGISIPSVVYCTGLCAHRRFMMITCIFLTMASYLVLLVMSLPSYSCFVRIPSVCDHFNNANLSKSTNGTAAHLNNRPSYSYSTTEERPFLIPIIQSTAKPPTIIIDNNNHPQPKTTTIKTVRKSTMLFNSTLGFEKQLWSNNQDDLDELVSTETPQIIFENKELSRKRPKQEQLENTHRKSVHSGPFKEPTNWLRNDPMIYPRYDRAWENANKKSRYFEAIANRPKREKREDKMRPGATNNDANNLGFYPEFLLEERHQIEQQPTNYYDINDDRKTIRLKREKPETMDTTSTESYDSIYDRIWPRTNPSCFIMLVVILIVGEMVSAPIDNIASNTWFVYLDEIDYTESHRKHLAYIPITSALVVALIGVVNVAQCATLGTPYTPYHLNFYVFGCLLGIALVTTYFFPTPQRRNTPVYYYGRGMDILRYFCTNSASTLLLTTVVVNGALYACMHDYLLWYIEDLNGSQFATSLAVAVAFFSDAVGKLILSRLQKRLSTNGLIVLGVAFYGVRFFLFTAIDSSWGVVFTQSVHCFSGCLFWKGIIVQVRRSYDSKAEQQILLVLHAFHYVIGYAMGTMTSGFLYNNYKPAVVFWVMGGISLTWACVLFLCFFAFDIRLQRKVATFETSLEGEQVSLFSVNSDHDEEEEEE